MFREDLKKDKNYSIGGQHSYKNIQNLPIKFPNKKEILVLTLLKYMSLSLNWDFVLIPTYLLGQIPVFYSFFLEVVP